MEFQFDQFFEVEGFEDLSTQDNGLRSACCLISEDEGKKLGWINVVVLDSKDHKELNNKYLGHNNSTDVLTFEFDEREVVNGEVYIDAQVMKNQAADYGVELKQEYARLVIHGVLHLMGYKDKSEKEKSIMGEKEDYYLGKIS